MKDQIEQLEDSAERTLDEMTEGVPTGKFRCDCGEIDDLDTAMPASASPYAPPICTSCFEKAIER